jgi:hypothetical protein
MVPTVSACDNGREAALAGPRSPLSPRGAALAASASGLGGAFTVAATGVVWVLSAAVMAAYPKTIDAGWRMLVLRV